LKIATHINRFFSRFPYEILVPAKAKKSSGRAIAGDFSRLQA